MTDKILYSIPEAAAKLSISRTVLYELMGAGDIKSVKIRSRHLVQHGALEDFVAKLAKEQGHE